MAKTRIITFNRLLQTTGALFIGIQVYKLNIALYSHFLREPYDLIKRYGDDTWVVVTGASDGIGKEIAKEFAKRGFNLFLISRTESKLQEIADNYGNKYKIKVKYLAKDFTKSIDDDFFDDIIDQTKDLDVSVLVNNVGVGAGGPIHVHTKEKIKDLFAVNIYPQVILTREFVPRMLNRKDKSAIINLSSAVGSQPFSTVPMYSATKVFNDYFSRAISYEYDDKIDIMSVRPSYVSTALTRHRKVGNTTISPEDCASEVVKKLGYEKWTGGHWKHSLINLFALTCPDIIMQPYMLKKQKERRKKEGK